MFWRVYFGCVRNKVIWKMYSNFCILYQPSFLFHIMKNISFTLLLPLYAWLYPCVAVPHISSSLAWQLLQCYTRRHIMWKYKIGVSLEKLTCYTPLLHIFVKPFFFLVFIYGIYVGLSVVLTISELKYKARFQKK